MAEEATGFELRVERVRGGFTASLRDRCGEIYRTAEPLQLRELALELAARGCPQTTIGDAFGTIDPTFQEQLGAR